MSRAWPDFEPDFGSAKLDRRRGTHTCSVIGKNFFTVARSLPWQLDSVQRSHLEANHKALDDRHSPDPMKGVPHIGLAVTSRLKSSRRGPSYGRVRRDQNLALCLPCEI